MVSRKANFQGPAMVIHVVSKDWQDFKGDIVGFTIENDETRLRDAAQLVKVSGYWFYCIILLIIY